MKTINVVAAIIIQDHRTFATQRGYGAYKDRWEFPGGKIEPGESPQEALAREIREELNVQVEVGEKLCTVEYDYPEFHLSMQCFLCSITSGEPVLLEHEAARWLEQDALWTVDWLPADVEVVEEIVRRRQNELYRNGPGMEPVFNKVQSREKRDPSDRRDH
ncbi:MAG: (deoxy)nucleoside triphosphate pyrophosphohydrolase [Firmicutes bacterium]|nr:(deoxy)nucleoside triphosphate pyrophosphohydrolase [Bacillota bacterium]